MGPGLPATPAQTFDPGVPINLESYIEWNLISVDFEGNEEVQALVLFIALHRSSTNVKNKGNEPLFEKKGFKKNER